MFNSESRTLPTKASYLLDGMVGGGELCSARIDLVWCEQGRTHLAFGTHPDSLRLQEARVQIASSG